MIIMNWLQIQSIIVNLLIDPAKLSHVLLDSESDFLELVIVLFSTWTILSESMINLKT